MCAPQFKKSACATAASRILHIISDSDRTIPDVDTIAYEEAMNTYAVTIASYEYEVVTTDHRLDAISHTVGLAAHVLTAISCKGATRSH